MTTGAQNLGLLPPQAVELEEAVIGAILLESGAIGFVSDILKPQVFYKPAHATIYAAVERLHRAGNPIDMLTVVTELKKTDQLNDVGGAYYISQLTGRVASAANIEFHARILVQKWLQRELIAICNGVIRESYTDETDVFDLIESAEQKIFNVRGSIEKSKAVSHISEIVEKVKTDYQARTEAAIQNKPPGIPSGLRELDMILMGWQQSDLIIVAARPAMGKTAFVLEAAKYAAMMHKKAVAIFSLEMSEKQLTERMIISESMVDSYRAKAGTLLDYEVSQYWNTSAMISQAPIFIDDTPALSIMEMRSKCRRLKAHHDIQLVIVDYLQLMTAGSDNGRRNREQEISTISRNLKVIAKELDVPVISLSQLSRESEKRSDKRPQLSDLRESGAIEQDADVVMFLHRPEYYGFTQDAEGNSTAGVAEIIVAKHRNGPVGVAKVHFMDRFAKFMNQASSPENLNSLQPNSQFLEDQF